MSIFRGLGVLGCGVLIMEFLGVETRLLVFLAQHLRICARVLQLYAVGQVTKNKWELKRFKSQWERGASRILSDASRVGLQKVEVRGVGTR
ncbi:uncharacterized protein BDW43DRAFT_275259 [Aspergillus alliaceus]|uniref:uncharacterized protein n=1 Tax=Petromyces alliaceus TaxID=209559 RepID=UPI0012A53C80|nr:uncharacterized protein BDW43DRAFT_275259 [Aspergillus alliaceus]KAB8233831.1 hypothetical protein BDW43DRAFT_275259 [Aspergillus alliaceus]